MSHSPSDPSDFFERLGETYVRRALVNGEFQAPLDARAKLWLEQAAETQSRISQRKVIWWMIIGVLATVSVGGAAAFATLAAN